MFEYEYKINTYEYDETFVDSTIHVVQIEPEKDEEPEQTEERARDIAVKYASSLVDLDNVHDGEFFFEIELVDVH